MMNAYKRKFPIPKGEESFIAQIRSLINMHLDKTEYRVLDLCHDLGISRTQLHRKIKTLTGRSTSLFLRLIRLEKAKDLILNSRLDIAEIAYTVGFNDPCYFNRVFAREYGISPGAYRDTYLSHSYSGHSYRMAS